MRTTTRNETAAVPACFFFIFSLLAAPAGPRRRRWTTLSRWQARARGCWFANRSPLGGSGARVGWLLHPCWSDSGALGPAFTVQALLAGGMIPAATRSPPLCRGVRPELDHHPPHRLLQGLHRHALEAHAGGPSCCSTACGTPSCCITAAVLHAICTCAPHAVVQHAPCMRVSAPFARRPQPPRPVTHLSAGPRLDAGAGRRRLAVQPH